MVDIGFDIVSTKVDIGSAYVDYASALVDLGYSSDTGYNSSYF